MHTTENKTPESRLLAVGWDVDANGCWIVQAKPNPNGYVSLYLSGEGYVGAHRMAYRAWHGEIPPGAVVRHSCHVRNCVNPGHLSVGTQQENIDDKVAANRQAQGEDHGCAKLTNEQARYIVHLRNAGIGTTELARSYGVSRTAIKDLIAGRTFWSVTSDIPRNVPAPGPTPEVLRHMWQMYCTGRSIQFIADFYGYKYGGVYKQLTKLACGKLTDAILDPEIIPLWGVRDS